MAMNDEDEEFAAAEAEQDKAEDVSGESDRALAKNPQSGFSRGVETDEYDIMPAVTETPEELDELAGKEGVELEYSFNGGEVREGLKIFQRETLYKKNAVYSLVLLLLFALYVVSIFKNPTEFLSIFLAALCLAVLFFIWYLPSRHVKKTAEAADLEEMKFKMTVYDDCVRIAEERGGFILHYGNELSKLFETPRLFLLCAGKERIFVLPKRCMDGAAEEKIRAKLKTGMGQKYIEVKDR